MKVVDLIIMLSQMPPDLEVVYNETQEDDQLFKLVYVEDVDEIEDNLQRRWVLLNPPQITEDEDEDK
jgi:hypothetical protein